MCKCDIWHKTKRHNQTEPLAKWGIWFIMAGRGFGKTRTGAQWIIDKLLHGKNNQIGIVGSSLCHVKNIMLYGNSGILHNACDKLNIHWQNKSIVYKNNSCFFFTDRNYEELRGYGFDYIWIDELCKFRNGIHIVDHCILCLRHGESKLLITSTPKDLPVFHNLLHSPDVHITRGSTFDNRENLSPIFMKHIKKFHNLPIGKQEIFGEIVYLSHRWHQNHFLYKSSMKYDYISIGIDPAVGAGITGIIIVGVLENKFFILNDLSSCESIVIWGKMVIEQYNYYEKKYGTCIINIEINQGGEVLISMLHMMKSNLNINSYRASLSKINRRTKLLYLYEKKQVYHKKVFDELEYEMLNEPKDRVDALVWAIESQNNNMKAWVV